VFDHKAYTEKSIGRLVKAKAKAEKATVVQTGAGESRDQVSTPVPDTPAEAMDTGSPSTTAGDGSGPSADISATSPHAVSSKDGAAASDRTALLRSKSAAVGRFMMLIVPVLIDVYAASVIASVRIKTLTSTLKAVSFLDEDGLQSVLNVSVHLTKKRTRADLVIYLVGPGGRLCVVHLVVQRPFQPGHRCSSVG
jgi:E3 ubiquitin-protein ligase TRIP12